MAACAIVVVPSIAIREGVKKSFEITAAHFMEHYGKKARFFVYNSSNLNQLDNFSSSSGINVMIINTQAFASSLKEDGRSKEARIILPVTVGPHNWSYKLTSFDDYQNQIQIIQKMLKKAKR